MKNFYRIVLGIIFLYFFLYDPMKTIFAAERFFPIQAIDTVKYSRDLAVEKMNDASFDEEIDRQVGNIAKTGATHIALGTPYDEQFTPFLKRWVDAARSYNLKIWYRGNLSGWEGWFDYKSIDRKEHTEGIILFIKKNSELFENGDIFTSCPECENGGPGDPRKTGDVEGFRTFLIDEYSAVKQTFSELGKNIDANYYSMNGDVAKLIMNKETTKALDGVVTIDHYIEDNKRLVDDINELSRMSGGKIMLGEIGAPIPDIHGEFSEKQQAEWLDEMFKKILPNKNIAGINYWVNIGGSTEIWDSENNPRSAVNILSAYYNPFYMSGKVVNDVGLPISDVEIRSKYRTEISKNGEYSIPLMEDEKVQFIKDGYISVTVNIDPENPKVINRDVVMNASSQSIFYRFFKQLIAIFKSLWI